jgi:glucan phosphoethanolaminetransferase (alkaline phosphatase superfamily)
MPPPEAAAGVDDSVEIRAVAAAGNATSAKRAARLRRWTARLLLLVPPLAVIALDLAKRRARVLGFEGGDLLFYLASCAIGIILWTSLTAAATRVKGIARWPVRVVLGTAAVLAVGCQLYTYLRYGAYVNSRAVLVGTSFLPSVGQQLWFDRWTLAKILLPCIALAIAVPTFAARLAPMRKRSHGWLCLDLAIAAALTAAFVSPDRGAEQGQPPDVMYVNAMGQLARAHWDHNETVERVHPGRRTPEAVPALAAHPAAARKNVVMIITESVRAQSVCVAHSPDCKYSPFSNALLPDRFPLTQMRSLDSTTAISLAVMWNGLPPTAKREAIHTAPILWEYAHAAGYESAYYTSQHMLFGNSGTWLEGTPWQRHVSATMLEEDATYEIGADDGTLVDWTLGDLDALREPYFVVLHLSNTHFPYKVDDADIPFQTEAEKTKGEAEVVDRYQDAIYLQDRALARFIATFQKRPEADRSVLVYVSDHGEQLRERGTVGHTGTLYDEEIRVPFWIAAPKGTLSASEEESLRAYEETRVTQLDVFPTMLDLLGLLDAPEIARFRGRSSGQSLLRSGYEEERAVVLSNCTELWACAFKNWGAMRGAKKLIASQGDRKWNCFDLDSDPKESRALDPSACGDLLPLTEMTMGGRPF